ncbi:hypothetical protein [Polaribacter uvawellassae]|uniref:hypothetical protein n=1 Tax=Polaribacter uvawellassae TaxID=3133495 RepID=UPI00321AF2FB
MMKKIFLLLILLTIVSCTASKKIIETPVIKTLKRPGFEVKHMSNWFVGKVRGKDTIKVVLISKREKSYSPFFIVESNYFILEKDLSSKELLRFILENDSQLRNDKELKFRVSKNYIEAIGIWKQGKSFRKKKIRYYKLNNSIFRAEYSSSIKHFDENEKEKKLFFGSLKFN